jgi:hypothetical protein
MIDSMVARCGPICTDCGAYRATRTMAKAAATRMADEWSNAFHVKVKVEHVWCDGCLVGGEEVPALRRVRDPGVRREALRGELRHVRRPDCGGETTLDGLR